MVAQGSVLNAAAGAVDLISLPATMFATTADLWHVRPETAVSGDILILVGFLLTLLAIVIVAMQHGRTGWKFVCVFFGCIALLSGCGLAMSELDLVQTGSLLMFRLQCAAGLSAILSTLALRPALAGVVPFAGPGGGTRQLAGAPPALPLRAGPGGALSLEDALRGTGAAVFAHAANLSVHWTTPLGEVSGSGENGIANSAPGASVSALSPLLRERVTEALRTALARNEAVATNFQLDDREGSPRWYELTIQPGVFADGERGAIGCLFDVTRFRRAEAHCRALLQETTHRAKNMLAVIQSVVRMSAKTLNVPPAAIEPFTARLQSVALAYDLLVREDWEGVTLPDLIRTQLNHALGNDASRATWSGPPLRLRPAAVQTLALALHELAVKAGAQGALTRPEGRLEIRWETGALKDGSPGYRLVWQENGGPVPERVGERKSFSRDILERLTPRGLRGEVSSTYAPDGTFHWEIRFPVSNVLSPP